MIKKVQTKKLGEKSCIETSGSKNCDRKFWDHSEIQFYPHQKQKSQMHLKILSILLVENGCF